MNYFQRLQRAIDFSEDNLSEDITLAQVAKEANCSLYHFHRLFKILVGNSVKEYIRKRRFTLAAKQLVETQKSVIDIAFDYQYGAPEAFTRAFKKMYGLSPLQYRKWGVFIPLHDKADLIKINLEEQKRGIKMKPLIKEKDEFIVVGIELMTRHGSCRQDVPKFWTTFSKKESLNKLKHLKNPEEIFGICYGSCNGRCSDPGFALDSKAGDIDFGYLICSEVENLDDVPEGFAFRTIPKGRYAVFTIKGGFSQIQEGVASIYKNWLSNTSYELADAPGFEKYDAAWVGKEDSEMEIWIPIK
ncbi:MAG: AraC family transcriptional regulator [Desulfobacteraceae bacterium]